MPDRARDKRGDKDANRARSRSPHESAENNLTEDDLRRIVSESMRAQIPSLILETSKVVSEQIADKVASDGQENNKSFTAFSQEMKVLKQKQEEVAYLSKAASLKSEGKLIRIWVSILFTIILFSGFWRIGSFVSNSHFDRDMSNDNF